MTLLELVLQLHGKFRRSLELIHVTPLQAGVLLFLHRHAEASLTEAAISLCVSEPTLSEVVKALGTKQWVIKRRSVKDTRAVCLSLSRRGLVLTRKIEHRVRRVSKGVPANKDLAAPDRKRVRHVPAQRKEVLS